MGVTILHHFAHCQIRWNPKELEPFEISNNQDIINIDIQVSHSNDGEIA